MRMAAMLMIAGLVGAAATPAAAGPVKRKPVAASKARQATKAKVRKPPPLPGDAVSTYRVAANLTVADFGYEFVRLPGDTIAIKRAGQLGEIVAQVACGPRYVLLAKGRPGQINTVACDGATPSAAALAPVVTLTR